jgi:hypothetical protein
MIKESEVEESKVVEMDMPGLDENALREAGGDYTT